MSRRKDLSLDTVLWQKQWGKHGFQTEKRLCGKEIGEAKTDRVLCSLLCSGRLQNSRETGSRVPSPPNPPPQRLPQVSVAHSFATTLPAKQVFS